MIIAGKQYKKGANGMLSISLADLIEEKKHIPIFSKVDSPIRSHDEAFEKVKELARLLKLSFELNSKQEFHPHLADACTTAKIPVKKIVNYQILGGDNIELATILQIIRDSTRHMTPDNNVARRWQHEKEQRTYREFYQAIGMLSKFNVDHAGVKLQIEKFLDRINDWTTTNSMLEVLQRMEELEGAENV